MSQERTAKQVLATTLLVIEGQVEALRAITHTGEWASKPASLLPHEHARSLAEYGRILTILEKAERQSEDENDAKRKTDAELEADILAEADAIRARGKKP